MTSGWWRECSRSPFHPRIYPASETCCNLEWCEYGRQLTTAFCFCFMQKKMTIPHTVCRHHLWRFCSYLRCLVVSAWHLWRASCDWRRNAVSSAEDSRWSLHRACLLPTMLLWRLWTQKQHLVCLTQQLNIFGINAVDCSRWCLLYTVRPGHQLHLRHHVSRGGRNLLTNGHCDVTQITATPTFSGKHTG